MANRGTKSSGRSKVRESQAKIILRWAAETESVDKPSSETKDPDTTKSKGKAG